MHNTIKKLNKNEKIQLAKDLSIAKAKVLYKYGFELYEIGGCTGIPVKELKTLIGLEAQ